MLEAPDLRARPFALTVARVMAVPAAALYRAWTRELDRWFAAPGSVVMEPRAQAPYCFETRFEGSRHAHYGRFLRLVPEALIEMTWMTAEGTRGAETVVTVTLEPHPPGTLLRLTHAGFPDESLCQRHRDAWPIVLLHLEEVLAGVPQPA